MERALEIQDSLSQANFKTGLTGSFAIILYIQYMYDNGLIYEDDFSQMSLQYHDYDFIATADKATDIYNTDFVVGDDVFVSDQKYPQKGKTFSFGDESFDLLLVQGKFSFHEIYNMKILTPTQLKKFYQENDNELLFADPDIYNYKIQLLDFIIDNLNLGPGIRYKTEEKEVPVQGRVLDFD